MRFVTQYPGMVIQIRPQRQRSLGDGSIEVTQEPIYVPVTPMSEGGFLFENEELQAAKQFSFNGRTQELDRATPSPMTDRLAVIDTEEMAEKMGWGVEVKELVEGQLLDMARTSPNDLFVVTTTPIQAPFPRYDTWDGDYEALAVRLTEDGFDLSQVLYYENTFGPKRPGMIAALEEMLVLEGEQTVSA